MNEYVKWGLIAFVGYLLYEQFTAGDLASTVGTTGSVGTGTSTTTASAGTAASATAPTTSPAAQVSLVSTVMPTTHNALQGTFVINGVTETIAVIPGGDAYNTNGQDITTTLAALGVTPAQLYTMLSAAYNSATAPGNASTGAIGSKLHVPITPISTREPGIRGINALAAGPAVHMRHQGGKWVM
jgi:hypothetical protein